MRNIFGILLLLGCVYFAPTVSDADFDFYGQDLIAKESYRKISMDFRDASLKNILKLFSEQAGLNFIAAQSVQDRPITLYLDQVPLQEALTKIMTANNLAFEMEPGSNVFVVKDTGRPAIELSTRVYSLKYTRLQASKLQKEIDSGVPATTVSGASGAGGGAGSSSSGTSGGGSIEDSVKNVLTSNGKVVTDLRTNSLIVTDVPSQFDVIEKVIALLDSPTPQVMIEVEMLDVSKSTLDQLGVDLNSAAGGHLASLTGSVIPTAFPKFLTENRNSTPAPAFTYGRVDTSIFTAVLDFLTTDTKTKFLARPRILTLSNETADIKIVTQEAIGQIQQQSSGQGATITTAASERVETGISLRVTPQVDPVSGMVTMFIIPTVSETKQSSIAATIKDPETRSSASTLMVKDGETIVVGGLIRDKEQTVVSKWPVLGDLPLVGMMFRHKNMTVEERELLVFLTPHIVGYENAAVLAKGGASFPDSATAAGREQSVAVGHKEQVDNMLEKWEN